tara:strand:+ start:1026 stop:2216 length:1191 start_codon:yes stop_codon:yes gene_type:complete
MVRNNKDAHLIKRNGYYYFQRRIAGTSKFKKQALRTKDISEARKLRDELVRIMDEQASKVLVAKSTLDIRNQYLSALDENEKEFIEEQVQDKADDLAYSLGVYEQLHDHTPTENLSPKAKEVQDFYNEHVGRLHVLDKWLPEWLPTLTNRQTRLDYNRGIKALMKHHPIAEDLNKDKVAKFFKTIGTLEDVQKSSVEKWRSGYISLWKFLELDTEIWRGHDIPKTKTKEAPPLKEAWTKDEVRMLYDTAVEKNHWLKHAIWIAVYTGARQSAIANLKYNRDTQTITFPKAKKEPKDRTIPAHTDILPNLEAWVQNRKASTTISNQFTLFKQSLGFGFEKDFHSFRRSLITEFENLECPENICADIVAHKKSTITYGLYSGGTSLDVMRKWLDKVKF